MKKPLQPRNVNPDKATRSLKIDWNDGHKSVIPYQLMRGWCPCAECQGHGGGVRWKEVNPVDLVKIEPVGLYGAQVLWTDMHGTGIFRFDTLRELCCCDACSASRNGEKPRPSNAL